MTNGTSAGPTELFDVGSHAWSLGTPMLFPAVAATGGTIDNVFYVAGGNTCGGSGSARRRTGRR